MSYNPGPSTVGYQLSANLAEYIQDAVALGAFVGALGQMDLNPALKPLLDAMNQILAGGSATVTVTQPGDPGKYNTLTKYLADGITESNKINQAAGYYVTIAA